MSGRAPRQKGDRLERAVVKQLQAAGLGAKRIPLSGSAAGYPGDVCVELAGRELTLECKSRKDFATLYGWLTSRDALILKGDRKDPLVVLRLDDVLELAKGDLTLRNSTEQGGIPCPVTPSRTWREERKSVLAALNPAPSNN